MMTVTTVTTMIRIPAASSNDIPKALDRQYADRARLMHEDKGRGLITVIDGNVDDIELEFVKKHLEGDLKDLIETLVRTYDHQKQYALIVMKNGELNYIGTRDL
jgi:hypothetical protein